MAWTLDILNTNAEILFSNCTNNMKILKDALMRLQKEYPWFFFWSLNTLEHFLISSKDALDSIREGNPSWVVWVSDYLCAIHSSAWEFC